MLVLDDQTIREILTIEDVIQLVESAFAEDARGRIKTLPVLKEHLPAGAGTWVVKAGHLEFSTSEDPALQDVIGLKLGGYCPANAGRGLPNHNAAMMLTDPVTGRPYTVLAANVITTLRTAAGGAIAAKWLSGEGSDQVAVLGAGDQAYAQLDAWLAIHPVKHVKVWARHRERGDEYANFWRAKGIDTQACSTAEEAVRKAGLIITATAAREPILRLEWVQPGAHINAIGADSMGKQELHEDLVSKATLFADKRAQSICIGEMQKPLALRLVEKSHVRAELGEICAGMKPGRTSEDEITIFDSTGVAFQDLVVAGHLQRLAARHGFGQTIYL
jgi:ornithine cyclodeaminase/alanine dehydrogenase-like protein (mu-crystallin family)